MRVFFSTGDRPVRAGRPSRKGGCASLAVRRLTPTASDVVPLRGVESTGFSVGADARGYSHTPLAGL